MLPFNRWLIAITRPLRHAIDHRSFRMFADHYQLNALKNRYLGEPMLIIGNGPSLNNTPLDWFAGVPSIGMNKIDMIFERTTWRPELVVCLNNLVARQNQDVFAASQIPVFLAWKARWYLKRKNRKRINFFNTTFSNAFSTDAVAGFGSSATVTYIALQMAYWMGANPVILLGVDHSFQFSGPQATYQKREGQDNNHFDPNYFKSGTYWGTPDLVQSELDYMLARAAFAADGRRVLDATVGGRLDVFEKITVNEAARITGVGK